MKTIVSTPKVPKTKDLMFFAVLCEVMDFHRTTFEKDLSGQAKHDFNILNKMLQNWRTRFLTKVSPESADSFDNTAAAAWEVFNEFMEAADKKQFLAVVKCYNEGLVMMEGDSRPLNEVPFQEVLEKGKSNNQINEAA
ncbi:hypothetical protein [Rufibacter latericius]|uniref:Uncharacterized protein n=1 Tax=Rufibacter latericius TaxID=2487040 RepID=A0A3M9MM91_9BACT|nr:hypothetical protein [Rufibacter latericius]RNI26601.1 hypothetical protein EFB08_11320 [Rufibacter latericius]